MSGSDGAAALVRMANQIARNHSYLTQAEAAKAVATHLRKFWTPQMRAELLADVAVDALDPVAQAAVGILRG